MKEKKIVSVFCHIDSGKYSPFFMSLYAAGLSGWIVECLAIERERVHAIIPYAGKSTGLYIFFFHDAFTPFTVSSARASRTHPFIFMQKGRSVTVCVREFLYQKFSSPFFFLYLLRKPASHWHCYYKLKTFSFVRMDIYGYIARRIYSIIMMMMYEYSKWDDTKAGEHSSFSLIYFYLSFSCVSNGADEWENWRQWRIFYHHHIHSPHIQL